MRARSQVQLRAPLIAPTRRRDYHANLPMLEAAQQLLNDAGYGGGFSLETIVMTGGYATAVDAGQAPLKSQLAEIGVDLQTTSLESSVYVERWLEADFDTTVALNGGLPDPYLMYGRYFSSEASLSGPAGLSDPNLSRLLDEGRAETDKESTGARSSTSSRRRCSRPLRGRGSSPATTTGWCRAASRVSRRSQAALSTRSRMPPRPRVAGGDAESMSFSNSYLAGSDWAAFPHAVRGGRSGLHRPAARSRRRHLGLDGDRCRDPHSTATSGSRGLLRNRSTSRPAVLRLARQCATRKPSGYQPKAGRPSQP